MGIYLLFWPLLVCVALNILVSTYSWRFPMDLMRSLLCVWAVENRRKASLSLILNAPKKKSMYWYQFLDGWLPHKITEHLFFYELSSLRFPYLYKIPWGGRYLLLSCFSILLVCVWVFGCAFFLFLTSRPCFLGYLSYLTFCFDWLSSHLLLPE